MHLPSALHLPGTSIRLRSAPPTPPHPTQGSQLFPGLSLDKLSSAMEKYMEEVPLARGDLLFQVWDLTGPHLCAWLWHCLLCG